MDDINVKGIETLLQSRMPAQIGAEPKAAAPGQGFTEMFKQAIESVNRLQNEAGRLEDAVAAGESVNIHQAVIMGEKAGLSFRLMMQVRNKLLDAYQEVSRMQV